MPEETFRIVVTIAVVLACIGFLVQSCVVIGLYRAIRRMQRKVEPLIERAEPVLVKVGPVIDSVKPVIDKVGPVVDSFKPVIEKTGATVDKVGPILENVRQIVEEARPRIVQISDESVAVAKSARKQVERAGDLLEDAGVRAKERLAQIDESLEQTVEQVGQVGGAMKRAVLKPVREVNGIAAGVSAAVSTIVSGPRRPTVETVTQDEEMFI
jgi:ElaB/YqjD/DUF883 family membrane-anchored ribosome-binding protein